MSHVLRPATPADAEALAALSAEEGAARWDAEAFRREMVMPHATLMVLESGSPSAVPLGGPSGGRVIESGGRQAGGGAINAFAVWWLVVDELHLLNIVVAPALRRRGLARRLMDALLAVAAAPEIRAVELEVRAGNEPAIRLYEDYGFERVGRRRRYYADGTDAVLMERRCPAR